MDRIESIRVPQMAAATVFMAGPEGLAIIDTIAVERAVTGRRGRTRLTKDESRYAASLLLDAGLGHITVGPMVGVDPRTIKAWFPERTKSTRLSDPVRCGTRRGYRAHLKRGESCKVCREANSRADAEYRRHGSYASESAVAA
ncbi:hypothetical protein ACWGN5_40200 [Streptomyces sp. NPDC055815]